MYSLSAFIVVVFFCCGHWNVLFLFSLFLACWWYYVEKRQNNWINL